MPSISCYEMPPDIRARLINNIPDWCKRLGELSDQIAERQSELVKFSDSESAASGIERTKSLRNKGSTESLKHQDDPETHPGVAFPPRLQSSAPANGAVPSSTQIPHNNQSAQPPQTPQPAAQATDTSPLPLPRNINGSRAAALHRQANQDMAIAQAKARATRSMAIVYYDSYVQNFFEELIKFVSPSRNWIRKAKNVQIKRMAELEMPDRSQPPLQANIFKELHGFVRISGTTIWKANATASDKEGAID